MEFLLAYAGQLDTRFNLAPQFFFLMIACLSNLT